MQWRWTHWISASLICQGGKPSVLLVAPHTMARSGSGSLLVAMEGEEGGGGGGFQFKGLKFYSVIT